MLTDQQKAGLCNVTRPVDATVTQTDQHQSPVRPVGSTPA